MLPKTIKFLHSPKIETSIEIKNLKYECISYLIYKLFDSPTDLVVSNIYSGIRSLISNNQLNRAMTAHYNIPSFLECLKDKKHFLYFDMYRNGSAHRFFIPSDNDKRIEDLLCNKIDKLLLLI